MKCQNCGKNEVSFLYRSNINGRVEEKCLCAECAEKLGYTQKAAAHSRSLMRSVFNDGFWGDSFFNDGFFGGGLLGNGFPGGMLENFFAPSFGRLPENPFDDFFANMPALGAPAEEAEKEQRQAPEESRFAQWRRRNALKQEMKQAIRQENFERAAEIRDELRRLEQEQEKQQADRAEQSEKKDG